jgi:DNA-binding GntR family transcriptional regulator
MRGEEPSADEQVPARNAGGVATELIRHAIAEGRLQPGERLKEKELAEMLGISRTPVREALLLLQAEGLVDAMPNRGATVKAYTEAELADLYELRALLEGYAARRAASRITEGQLAILRETLTDFAAARHRNDREEIFRVNLRFHYTIVEASGVARLANLVRATIELPLVYRSFYLFSPAETELSEGMHRRVTSALTAGDAERAELLMKEHIFEGRDHLLGHLREQHAVKSPRRRARRG